MGPVGDFLDKQHPKKGKGNPTCGAVLEVWNDRPRIWHSLSRHLHALRVPWKYPENHCLLLANGFSPWNNLNNKKIDHNTNLPRSFFFFTRKGERMQNDLASETCELCGGFSQINSLKRKVIWSSSQTGRTKRKKNRSFALVLFPHNKLHPGKLTYPLKRDYFNRKYIFQPSIFRGHVSFQGSTAHEITHWICSCLVFRADPRPKNGGFFFGGIIGQLKEVISWDSWTVEPKKPLFSLVVRSEHQLSRFVSWRLLALQFFPRIQRCCCGPDPKFWSFDLNTPTHRFVSFDPTKHPVNVKQHQIPSIHRGLRLPGIGVLVTDDTVGSFTIGYSEEWFGRVAPAKTNMFTENQWLEMVWNMYFSFWNNRTCKFSGVYIPKFEIWLVWVPSIHGKLRCNLVWRGRQTQKDDFGLWQADLMNFRQYI